MNNCVFGVAGKTATGKGTLAKLLKEWYPGTPVFRFSDPLREFYISLLNEYRLCGTGEFPRETTAAYEETIERLLVGVFGEFIRTRLRLYRRLERFSAWLRIEFAPPHEIWPKEASTKDLQDISTQIRQWFGEDTMACAIVERAEKANREGLLVVVEGIRRVVDVDLLSASAKFRFFLAYVETKEELRYERFIMRNEKPGDALLSFAQFQKIGQAEPERQIESLKSRAQYVLLNNGTAKSLEVRWKKRVLESLSAHQSA